MAVFRIEKTRDYTVMANHHLRNTKLSLKAKGLLSLMLSLPEDWDYTTKGLAKICKDGVDSICSTVNELEEHGYVIRERIRNAKGQLTDIQYTILEQPKPPQPGQGKPKQENPVLDIKILSFMQDLDSNHLPLRRRAILRFSSRCLRRSSRRTSASRTTVRRKRIPMTTGSTSMRTG